MYPNLKHRRLQNGSDMSPVGFLSVEKAAEASPSTGTQKQLCLSQADGRWLMRGEEGGWGEGGGGQSLQGCWSLSAPAENHDRCRPSGSVNPHLRRHPALVTPLSTSSDFQVPSLSGGRQLS